MIDGDYDDERHYDDEHDYDDDHDDNDIRDDDDHDYGYDFKNENCFFSMPMLFMVLNIFFSDFSKR